jgi:hypothetical protein
MIDNYVTVHLVAYIIGRARPSVCSVSMCML